MASTISTGLPGPPLRAQTGPAEIELLRQPLFYRADDQINLRVGVTNTSETRLEGFQIQIALYDRVTGRIDLHESFDGPDEEDRLLGAVTVPFDHVLDPGESRVVTVDTPLTSFPEVDSEGVYPMAVELHDPSFTQILDSFTSHAIYYAEDVDTPLNLALVVPLSPLPARAPSGSFVSDVEGNYPLEEAVSSSGWITGVIDALQESTEDGLSLGLAPSPRFVEELAGMSDGYARMSGDEVEQVAADAAPAESAAAALTQLDELLTSPRVQILASPYSNADFPTLYESLSPDHVTRQLEAGRAALAEGLPQAELDSSWLYVEGSRWDEKTLEQVRTVRRAGGSDLNTFIEPELFEPPVDETIAGCPADISPPGSFTCAVEVETDAAPVPAYVADPDVQDRFADLAKGDEANLYLHRLFAETALIHAEHPDAVRRIVHATVPASWQPSPVLARRLFTGLARAPWLAPRTPAGGFTHSVKPRAVEIAEDLNPLEVDDPGYFEALNRTAGKLDTFTEIGAPEQRRDRLGTNLLVAEDQRWWLDPTQIDRGLAYAIESESEIEEEFGKITISGPDTTLTSQRSAIEVNVFNETTYPVTIDVDFEASRPEVMRIDETNSEALQDIVVQPGSAPAIKVDAIADTSGFFQVKASVESPDEGREINSQFLTVRSTNFNRIALGLTLGALVFLILFYLWRFIRRRRARIEVPAESTSS